MHIRIKFSIKRALHLLLLNISILSESKRYDNGTFNFYSGLNKSVCVFFFWQNKNFK